MEDNGRWSSPAGTSRTRDSPQSPPRKRRTYPSCAECKRTKARCSRSWPCTECVKRGIEHLCPDNVTSTAPPKAQTIAMLTRRVAELEAQLQRLGQSVEAADDSQREPDGAGAMPARPHDMTALLGRLALGPAAASTKRYAGTEGAAFYLSEDEDGDEAQEGRDALDDLGLALPWARGGAAWLGGVGSMPGALVDRCRALMVPRRVARELWAEFWGLTSWRVQPITPAFFAARTLPALYDAPAGPQPHQLALFFALAAATLTLDASSGLRAKLPGSSGRYLSTAWACLVTGNVFTSTTLESLIAIALIGLCLLNSEDKRSPDGSFALFGLGVRLGVIAGYHRDPALLYTDMSVEDMDARRRIWHELLASDRLHSMPALLPNSVDLNHYDTKLPSDADPRGYFVWKWTIGVQICKVVDYWTSVRIPSYEVLQDIDAGLRRLLHALPLELRSPDLTTAAYRLDRPSAPPVQPSRRAEASATGNIDPDLVSSEDVVVRQRIRLAMHFCMLFFYLHRPCFIRALVANDSTMDLSVHTMVETCEHVVTLTGAVMTLDWSLSRWFSFAADLFSVLHCLTALIIKSTDQLAMESHMGQLERGVEILQWTCSLHPTSKNRALLQGAQRLLANAHAQASVGVNESISAAQPDIAPALSPRWNEWLDVLPGVGMPNMPVSMEGLGMGLILEATGGSTLGVDEILGLLAPTEMRPQM
ncbi:hypothetical protein Q8F55_004475 [Vanrija albida]|uniref:Zn(2)-C6 fungal-type domain-containing protein n=1 Tax=Vanrija albida TaxID=181172 RepID=A0ABR3Q6V7_9TREE